MQDITYSSNLTEWQSLNTLSGIAVGAAMLIQNKSINWFILQESSTKPLENDKSGVYITDLYNHNAVATTEVGDLEYWIRPASYGNNLLINVQEG